MGSWVQRPLWSWVLWVLWVLSAQVSETAEQPPMPAPAPAEPGSISPAADSTSAELSLDLGTCQALPATAAARPEHPSSAGRTTASSGSHDSGSLVLQVTTRSLVPAKSSGEQGQLPSMAALPRGPAMRGSPDVGAGAGVSSPGAASHPTSIPPAPTTARHRQLPSLVPTGQAVAVATGSGGAGPATAISYAAPGVPAIMATSKPPSNSSTAPKQAVLDSIPGELILGTTVPMQEGTAAEPPVGAASALIGASQAPGMGLSPSVTHIPAAQAVPGTKASSLVTVKSSDANESVRLGDAVTAEGVPGAAQTMVPLLPQDKHSTGTSPPRISKSYAESHTSAVLPSLEVTPGLDEATLLPATAASISWDTGNPVKPAAASASPATGLPSDPPNVAIEGPRTATPPSAEPPSASSAKVTFSSATIAIGKATESGTGALSNASHNASQDAPVPHSQPPPALSPHHPSGAVLGAGEPLPRSRGTAPGNVGDRLPGDNAVTHPRGTALAPGMLTVAMDATAGEHVPTTSFRVLGSSDAGLVSVRSEPSTRVTAATASTETPVGLSMRLFPQTDSDSPAGPSPGPFAHSMGSLLPQTPSASHGATTAEAAAGSYPPASPNMAMSLSLTSAGGRKPDRTPQAAAAPTSSLSAPGIGTGPAAHPSSLISNTQISEAGMGTTLLASGNAITMLWDTGATPAVPDASPSRSQPVPTASSAPPGTAVTPGPAPAPPLQAGPQRGAALSAETWSPSAASGMGTAVPGTAGVPRAATAPVALHAGVPPLLEGSPTAGIAPGMSPSNVPTEMAAGLLLLSLATPLPEMGASGDTHPDGSTAGRVVEMASPEVGAEEDPGASTAPVLGTGAAGIALSHTIVTTRPSPDPPTQRTNAPKTRSPADQPLLAPRGGRSAPSAMSDPSPALAMASLLPKATSKTPQSVTLPIPKSTAVEGGGGRSPLAGDGSTMQAAPGSTLVENTSVDAATGTPQGSDIALGTAPMASTHTIAGVTVPRSMAALDHSYRTAEPTTDMDMDTGMASLTTANGATGLHLGLPTPMAGAAESGTRDAIPAALSVPGSKSPTAVAVMDTASTTAPEPVTAPSSGLTHSNAEPDVSVFPPVPRNTYSMAVASSIAEDEPSARVSWLAVGHTHTWETTSATRSDDGGTTAQAVATSSESRTKDAASPASTKSTHVPVSNTAGTSLDSMSAASVFPSNAILPATSAARETFVVTEAITAVPSATAKATSTSNALAPAVMRDEADGSGQPVLSQAPLTPTTETTAGSWDVLDPSSAIVVPGSPLPGLHSPAEEPATAPLSALGAGAAGQLVAGWTPSELATGATSPTTVTHHVMGQAATSSPPGTQTFLAARAWGEKTAITADSTTAITTDSTTSIAAGNTTAITPGSTMSITAGSTTAIAAGSTTSITAGSAMTITAGSTTAITAGSTMNITAGSTTAITAGSTKTITTDSTTAIDEDSTTAIAAGSTTTITAGSTTAIAAGSTTAFTSRRTVAIAASSAVAITASSTVAVAPEASSSPAKEMGGLLTPDTTALGRPPATTSPATTLTLAFGTQRGSATAQGTSAHTTVGLRNPTPEAQPTRGLIVPAASLYPFGAERGDQECIQRKVDFNSPLFKPEIGFPFGKSLRDALYFTDNGQIIFPPTDNYVPSNPNPPPQGFSGWESLPMVAAFWDDADFSQGVGTTWYQEYSTFSFARDPLVHDVEGKIEKYLKTPYVAKWTLKVTWEKAPVYPSRRDDTRTSTYQAVLTTDGNRSFALLLFQDGGMRWDYAELAAGNVLIGFSSGDGYAQNNELTQKPPSVKYRPDQHISTSTDVRGLWIYRLDSRSRVNYRLRCLAWLDAEPAPAAWNSELLPCPCSQPQAELDPRYRWSRGLVDASVSMLRTASPSPTGAGVRCLYQDGSLLEGWQERAWSPPIHPTADGELEAFDWCCRRVEKPLFCTRLAEKRPRVTCEGYMPPTLGGAFGDPHITTLDGLTYTFNGLGDFVLLLASDAWTSFVLHGRTARTGMAQATNFLAFAAQYISTTTTIVEWTLGSQGDVQVLLNHKTIQFSYSQDMAAEVYYSPGVLLVNASSVTAVFDGAVSISVLATSGILSVVCSLPNRYRNGTKGLLGVWDHNPADDFQMPNGTSIPVNSSEQEIYNYGMTWAVGEHSLFAQPLDTPVMNFTPIFLSQLRQENESQYQLAASQCHSSKECIYDSLSTGDVALGLTTQSLTADFQQKKTVLNAFPPVITGDASLTAFRTERVRRQYHAMGVGTRFVPHLSPDLNISESGTLTWEPRGMAPLTISLEAVGSNNLSALLQLHFTLCSCSRSQECDYNNTVTLGGSSLQLAACRCDGGYSGLFCQDLPDPCAQGCFPGVDCDLHVGCGPCPAGLTGDGLHCSDIDECAQGTTCPGNTTCTNTVGSYTCSCPAGEEGEGPGCGSACGSHSCPEGYCSNGGRCRLHPITCTPTCVCPPAFTDHHCLVAGGDFRPPASTDLPQRSVQLRVRTLQNATSGEVNSTVSAILGSLEVKAFQSNTNITQMTDSDGFTFAVVSEFAYDSRGTIIRFLNEDLPGAIIRAFNRQQRRRETDMHLLFQTLHQDDVTDLVKLTVADLRHYFPCDLYGYKGYQLHYVGNIGFICMSPCKMGYCQHGGQCLHLPEGPTCSCLPFSIFSPTGARCERMAVSLAAFLGILLGALALLCLLLTTACLALHLCRGHHRWHRGAKETFWRSRTFSSLTMAGEQAEPTHSHSPERHWEPQLQAIDPSVQIRIQRPHVRPPSQPHQLP